MKLAIVGSRSFINKNRLFLEIDEFRKELKLRKLEDITEIISGGAGGADTLAAQYASEKKLKKTIFNADWSDMAEPCIKKVNERGNEYNALAGFSRNQQIIDNSDKVIAFWDMKSPGTADSVIRAKQQGKLVKIVKI